MAPLTAPSRADLAERHTALADTAAGRGVPWRRLGSPAIVPAFMADQKVQVAESWRTAGLVRPVWLVRDGRGGLEAAWLPALLPSGQVTRSGPLTGALMDALVADWLAEDRMPLFVARDQSAARRLVELLGRRGPGDGTDARTCAAQMRVALGLPASTRLVVLEKALDVSLWRPSKVRPGDVASWGAAYGLGDDWEGLGGLLRIVADPAITVDADQGQYAKALVSAEGRAVRSTDFRGGPIGAAAAFAAAQAAQSAWEAYVSCDRTFAPQAAAAGDAPLIRALKRYPGGRIAAQLSTPCRLRVGHQVRIFHPDGSGEARLERLDYNDEDGLIGVFVSSATRAGARSRGFSWLERQAGGLGGGEVGRVCAKPYLPNLHGSQFSPWLLRQGDIAPVVRQVPLDVSLIVGG